MRNLVVLVCLFLIFHTTSGDEAVEESGHRVFIVYMGGPTSAPQHPVDLLISSVARLREENAILHTYKNGFSGFVARLSVEEADEISRQPGVVSVFQDPVMALHTTRSWDFLHSLSSLSDGHIDSSPSASSLGSDIIIGVLDTGIWPESQSFDDKDMGPVPSKWKGICMEGVDFNSSHCNRKIVGARYYIDPKTARDTHGHGTHVASTAAGTPVINASYYGLASGTAKGRSPASRLAMYRVCTENVCLGSAVLAAMDDAIADGVDVLSLSLGPGRFDSKRFSIDPVAIGAFHAVQKGVMVVGSAGNDGPFASTVVNVAPWILTVAASTIDRVFEHDASAAPLHWRTIIGHKPAPIISIFSSRGPSNSTRNLLKPDVAAPGFYILAAWRANDTDPTVTPRGMRPPQYVMIHGTSMACPHVSGVAAMIKSQHPSWSPAAIRSAIMTTAVRLNNVKAPIRTEEGKVATAYDYGAGELNPSGALDPGLVYDLDPADYLNFLCFNGYKTSEIKLIQPSLPATFSCPRDSNPEMIWKINYPSISVHKDVAAGSVQISRTLTNVAQDAIAEYNVSVIAPDGLVVEVEPKTLMFTAARDKLTYTVRFSSASTMKHAFGFVTWKNGKHKVSMPYVVSA